MSVGSHVVVNVDEIGGDVIGNHDGSCDESEDLRVVSMSFGYRTIGQEKWV